MAPETSGVFSMNSRRGKVIAMLSILADPKNCGPQGYIAIVPDVGVDWRRLQSAAN